MKKHESFSFASAQAVKNMKCNSHEVISESCWLIRKEVSKQLTLQDRWPRNQHIQGPRAIGCARLPAAIGKLVIFSKAAAGFSSIIKRVIHAFNFPFKEKKKCD